MRVPSNWMERKPYTVVNTMGTRIPLTEKQAMENTAPIPINPISLKSYSHKVALALR